MMQGWARWEAAGRGWWAGGQWQISLAGTGNRYLGLGIGRLVDKDARSCCPFREFRPLTPRGSIELYYRRATSDNVHCRISGIYYELYVVGRRSSY